MRANTPCHLCGSTRRYRKRPYNCLDCNIRWNNQSKKTRELRIAQTGKPCAICGLPMNPPNYDERPDHTFRGWLCSLCNIGLGRFRDNPSLLAKAREYLLWWFISILFYGSSNFKPILTWEGTRPAKGRCLFAGGLPRPLNLTTARIRITYETNNS